MDLSLLLLADYANVTAGSKLNVMGIFDRLSAGKFPAMHPQMFLISRFSGGVAEYGRQFEVNVKLINEDATQILVDVTSQMTMPRGSGGRRSNANHIMRLNNVTFPEPGTYEFSVLVDNDLKGTVALEVVGAETEG